MGERESADDNQTRASPKERMTIVSAVPNKIDRGNRRYASLLHARRQFGRAFHGPRPCRRQSLTSGVGRMGVFSTRCCLIWKNGASPKERITIEDRSSEPPPRW